MTFTSSTAPDVTESIPAALRAGNPTATAAKRGSVRWDVSIGGIGFVLGIHDQRPYERQSAPSQKEQFDTSPEAGEQTLDGYWLRSQTSWHLGAGINFYEPGDRDRDTTPSRYRFTSSTGVDVWTEGDVTLLKRTVQAETAAGWVHASAARVGGADHYFTTHSGLLKRWTDANVATTYTGGAASVTTRPAVAGSKVVVGHALGLDSGDVSAATKAALYTQASAAAPVPYWAKGRLIATRGNKVFELALDGSSGTTAGNLDTVTALFTHPDPGWVWTGVAESPTAILAAGHSGGLGTIYSFTLETAGSGSTPKLGQPFPVAEFPPGEEVHSIHVYLGTYVGIGTSRGLRVGVVAGDRGELQYGPLLFRTDSPVKSLAARDSFLYAAVTDGVNGKSGCARVDLGSPIGESLRFPWAFDAQTGVTGEVSSVAFVGHTDRVVLGVKDVGVYAQSATLYETEGTLLSGAVRFGTTIPKVYRVADLRCRTEAGGDVALALVGPTGLETSIITLSEGRDGSNLSLASVASKQEHMAYRLTLHPSADGTVSPKVESVALKAMPAVRKQRLIKYPVKMESGQRDGAKTPFGSADYAARLVLALEELEESGEVVQVTDHRNGETYPATIESLAFRGTTPGTGGPRGGGNFGGQCDIVVRKL